MARNEDEAARRRAKRKGENPKADDASESTTPAPDGSPADDTLNQAISDTQRAENEARQGITGAPVDVTETLGENLIETDFDPAPGGEVVGGESTAGGGGPRVFRFLKASWAELQRVRWPNRQQVGQGTAVTLGFVVVAGAYLGVADVIARQIVNLII